MVAGSASLLWRPASAPTVVASGAPRDNCPDLRRAGHAEDLYLVVRSLELTGRGRRRWTYRWKPALNAVATTLEGERVDCDGRGWG